MADRSTPIKNQAWGFSISLGSQANTKLSQENPTLAAGDVTVQTDDGAIANIASLPTSAASSTRVKVALSPAEMNGDEVWVRFHDVSGAQWCDKEIWISPTAAAPNTVTPPSAAAIADAVFEEPAADHVTATTMGGKLNTRATLGAGSSSYVVTVNDGNGDPMDGVSVWVTTDIAGTNPTASGVTDDLGQVTFLLDPGTYYLWKQLAGFDFTNPEQIQVT